MATTKKLIEKREQYSIKRLSQFKKRLSELPEAIDFPGLTIVGAGSFARYEGSEHSDIDLFFFCIGTKNKIANIRTLEFSLFGKLISLNSELKFPPFSADSKFLEIMYLDDQSKHLGSPQDDHQNFFTARMLLLLESKCLFNEDGYKEVINQIVSYYYRDYPRHPDEFFPTFLINDISRYWKTILLNYENKRAMVNYSEVIPASKKIKHKIKNFKLKFSRLTTCFATIAAIGSYSKVVTEDDIKGLVNLTPRQRLEIVCDNLPQLRPKLVELLESYSWFIEKTGLSTIELELEFSDKKNRDDYFERAKAYRKLMIDFIDSIDIELDRDRELIERLAM